MFDYQNFEAQLVQGMRVYFTPVGPLPSITTMLGKSAPAEKTSYLDAWRARVGNSKADKITNDAATRGTNTHLMLERFVNGEEAYKLNEFPEAHINIFKSMRLELKKINKVYGQEVVLYSDILGVAGRCDLVAEHQGVLSIVDYKTSSRIKNKEEIGDYWLQTAFYAIAHNEMFGTNIEKLVIIMGVENHLPMVFRKVIDDGLLLELSERVSAFYSKL